MRTVIWVLVFLAMVVLCLASPANAGQWSVSTLTDAKQIEGRAEFKGAILSGGPVVSWDEDQPEHLWGAGAFAFLDVTPDGQIPIRNLIPAIGDWLNLPETVPATIKLGGQVQAVGLAESPQAQGGPMLEIEVGPTLWSLRFAVVESDGRGTELPIDSGWQFMFGLKPIRFGKP